MNLYEIRCTNNATMETMFVYLIGKTLEQAMESIPKQYDGYAKLPTSKVSRLSKYWEVE